MFLMTWWFGLDANSYGWQDIDCGLGKWCVCHTITYLLPSSKQLKENKIASWSMWYFPPIIHFICWEIHFILLGKQGQVQFRSKRVEHRIYTYRRKMRDHASGHKCKKPWTNWTIVYNPLQMICQRSWLALTHWKVFFVLVTSIHKFCS